MRPELGVCALLLLKSLTPGQGPADLVAKLGSSDHRTRHGAFQKLRADKTPETLALLRAALPSYSYHGQNLGLSLVERFPRELCEPVMRSFLPGKPSFLRLGASAWLYQKGDHSVDRHIGDCLRSTKSQEVLGSMLSRASRIQTKSVLDAVADCLTEKSTAHVLDLALRMLRKGKVEQAIPRIEAILKVEDLDVDRRVLCAGFLVVMDQVSHLDTLVAGLGELENIGRLASLLREEVRLDHKVLAAILEFTRDKKGRNVRQSLELLAKHNYRAGVSEILTLLDSDDAEIRKAAFSALMRIGDGLQPKRLYRLLDTWADNVVLAAANALRRMDDSRGLPRVIACTKAAGKTQLEAFDVLVKYRDRRVIPVLLEGLQDADRKVHSRAFRGVQTVFRALFPYRKFDFAKLGYTPAASPAQRRAAAEKLRVWWRAHPVKK
jgi:HEAT repeat protein